MILIHETLTTSENSTSFTVNEVDEFALAVEDGGGSGFNGATITLQMSPDNGTTWTDFTSGGADVTFTSSDRHKAIEYGGALFRFTCDGTASVDVDCYAAGPNVQK